MDKSQVSDAKARKPAKNESRASASDALATPTDLKSNAVNEVAEALNGLVADAFVLYLKTKNFHWHISGPNFRDYHLLLDDQASDIYDSIDPLAERVRKLGARTLHSFGDILRITNLDENNAEFVPPEAMLKELLDDNRTMAEAMRKAHKVCDDAEDSASASLIENYLDATEKRIWFLFETTRNAERAKA